MDLEDDHSDVEMVDAPAVTQPMTIAEPVDFSTFEFIRLSKSWTTRTLVEQDAWFIYIQGILIQPRAAFEKVLDVDTRLGSKSTASIFLLALRYCLTVEDPSLALLLSKIQTASSEFARKLAFRLLSPERPDKLMVLIRMLIHFPVREIDGLKVEDSLLLSLQAIKQVLLATVDVRHVILRAHNQSLIKWLVLIVKDASKAHMRRNETLVGIIEHSLKCLQDLVLVAEKSDFEFFLGMPLVEMFENLFKVHDQIVADNGIRLLSFFYEYASDEVKAMLDSSSIFETLLREIEFNHFTQIRILDHFASHFTPRIPPKYRMNYFEKFLAMKNRLSRDHNMQGANDEGIMARIIRCLYIMQSTGIRLGVFVMNREVIENRRQKQIWMRRQCEGCQKTEQAFGEFMMCAGCRKVRYCSKECQVKDWKYHRMQCHFFRPRPGFRSRGTQTSIEASTQTHEDSNGVQDASLSHHTITRESSTEESQDSIERSIREGRQPAQDRLRSFVNQESSSSIEQPEDDTNGHTDVVCQTDISYPVNFQQWRFSTRRDEGTETE